MNCGAARELGYLYKIIMNCGAARELGYLYKIIINCGAARAWGGKGGSALPPKN
jgi:hypothetical protein